VKGAVAGGIDTVIVAYASEAVIDASIRSAAPLGGQVVVVDHGGGGSAGRAAALGATTFHDPTNPGFGSGQNRGVGATTSEYVLLCNPDAEVVAEAVRSGREYLDTHPGVAAVQGVVLNQASGTPERSQGVAVGPLHLLGRAVGARRLHRFPVAQWVAGRSTVLRDHAQRVPAGAVEVESLAATVLLVRRSAFDSVAGFDPVYFLYGEDLDLCRRLRRAGWTLVALPQVWATHQSGGSALSSHSREVDWWRGTMRYASLWFTPGQWSVAVLAAALTAARLSVVSPGRARLAWSALVGTAIRTRRARRRTS
jgi:N-acetylglucosaminyl-diphospho-decaprenol L-rhamnosyltransferase